ncbi:MAG: multidrug effflux MFS transporter [Coriobacteriia bacterium]|nr:multidrug effflux MFS transporter [Coriobacteriia bacterium]
MEQKYLHKWGILILVTLLNMVAPLSTDMYMPALPIIASDYNVSASAVDATMYAYTICTAVGILILSPISDKYGRKKILLSSLAIYGFGSFTCTTAPNIEIMIVCRVLQAIGGGGMSAIAIAIIKDCFAGKTRGVALSVVQSMFVVGPILAPIIGAWVLTFASWRAIFIVQGLFSIIMIILALFYIESIPKDEIHTGKITHTYKQIFIIAKNKNFITYLLMGSCYFAPFMGYLALSSFVYQDVFHLSPQEFSMFFAINGLVSIVGPLACIYFSKKDHKMGVQTGYLIIGAICTIMVFIIGNISAVAFLLCIIPYNITTSFQRPFVTDILLEQHDGDTGSASALINFVYTIFGGIGMIVASAPWGDFVFAYGITCAIFISAAVILWVYICKSKSIKLKGM